MFLKKIEKVAKYQHALLLAAAAGLVLAVGTTSLTSADSSTVDGTVYHKPSTSLAQKTDLGQDLSYHAFKSRQFDDLLVHQFKEDGDSDVAAGGTLGSDNDIDKPNATFKLSNGLVEAYGHTQSDNSYYSDVSDAEASDHSEALSYFVTKHNLVIRQMFMEGVSRSALRLVKYHLHSVGKADNGNRELIFYPTEFSTKDSNLHIIKPKQQSNYPMHIYVKGTYLRTTSNHSHKDTNALLPD